MRKPRASLAARPAPDPEGQVKPDEFLLHAFNDLRDDLLSTLTFTLGNSEDAHDVAQEAFLRCWRTQEDLPDVQNLRAWIFRVALNAAKDLQRSAWRRRAKPLPAIEIMPLIDDAAPPQVAEENESLQRLREALLELRPEEKEVFLLRQNGDLTYEEIAQMRNRPVGTVKTQMRSALQKLRQLLT